jgi:hypothetical protein
MRSYQPDTTAQSPAEAAFVDFGWIVQGNGCPEIGDLSLAYRKQKAGRTTPRPHILFLWISVLLISICAFWISLRQTPRSHISEQDISSTSSTNVSDDFSRTEKSDFASMESNSVIDAKTKAEADSSIAGFFTPEVHYWAPHISRWAQQYDLDPNIIATIMQIESCGNPHAVSHAGAQGLFQVMPFHFQPGENMQDPDTNAKRGLAFIKKQLEFTGGDIYLSFAGYNGGYAASGGHYSTWPHETRRYFYWAKGIYSDGLAGAEHSPRLDEWLTAGGQSACISAAKNLGI